MSFYVVPPTFSDGTPIEMDPSACMVELLMETLAPNFAQAFQNPLDALSYCVIREEHATEKRFLIGSNCVWRDKEFQDRVDATEAVEMMLRHPDCVNALDLIPGCSKRLPTWQEAMLFGGPEKLREIKATWDEDSFKTQDMSSHDALRGSLSLRMGGADRFSEDKIIVTAACLLDGILAHQIAARFLHVLTTVLAQGRIVGPVDQNAAWEDAKQYESFSSAIQESEQLDLWTKRGLHAILMNK